MPSVNDLIEALMEVYFEEEDTTQRYAIFEKVEKAIRDARAVTAEQIALVEDRSSEDILLEKMSKIVSNNSGVKVHLTPSITFYEISQIGTLDSLDMVEIVMNFEEILDVDIESDGGTPDPDMTIRDVLNLRKDS